MTWELALKWMARILAAVMPIVSPALKKELTRFFTDLHEKALKTKNPVDDFITGLFLYLLGLTEDIPAVSKDGGN